jgi:hypothetical protein
MQQRYKFMTLNCFFVHEISFQVLEWADCHSVGTWILSTCCKILKLSAKTLDSKWVRNFVRLCRINIKTRKYLWWMLPPRLHDLTMMEQPLEMWFLRSCIPYTSANHAQLHRNNLLVLFIFYPTQKQKRIVLSLLLAVWDIEKKFWFYTILELQCVNNKNSAKYF